MAVVAFFLNYQKKVLLQKEAAFQMEKEHQYKLLKAVIVTKEKEQQRIGRDLHDDIGVQLSLIKMTLRSITNNIEYTSDLNAKLDEQSNKLSNVIESVRKISQDMMPAIIEQFGLERALENLLASVKEQTGIEVDFFADSQTLVFLTDDQDLSIYRIVQELLNNSLKHGQPTSIRLDMLRETENLLIVYSDNGKGFDQKESTYQNPGKKPGLGLKNLEARTQLLDGTFTWESAPNQGFTAHLIIPMTLVSNPEVELANHLTV